MSGFSVSDPTPTPTVGRDLWAWRSQARQNAEAVGIDPDEVDWLLHHRAGIDRLTLHLGARKPPETVTLGCSLQDLDRLWTRRSSDRVPLQYLVGTVPWRHFDLLVSPAVLIPRPETEAIIDIAETAAEDNSGGIWVDLGTGSGAIALGLAEAFPDASIVAVDASEDALAVAIANAERCGAGDRVCWLHGSWFEPLTPFEGQVRGLVSNPPYIPSEEVLTLQPEVRRHEPHLALDGGRDGLDALRHLAETAPDYLADGGIWLVEHMAGQSEAVRSLLETLGCYRNVRAIADFAGIDRFVLAYFDANLR
ncbi:protein-(glutamine-N5) methyltransferase, release factor-specific [Leptolyngbya valderiana BDU 20041]|nr:protein-(glutamine-N5) methyltransferase, release factor-specific [Leptolyngbya valderiana BDU 20041]